jgi:vacuolar-type H+-ATPase catalytic subunit A/Vma1
MQQALTSNVQPRTANRLRLSALMVGAVVVIAACGQREENREFFDGFYFKAKTGATDKKTSRAVFSTTISGVSQSLEGARQAGAYEGTKYCIAQYGTSQIVWTVGPDTEPQNLTIVDDKLTFAGRCDP